MEKEDGVFTEETEAVDNGVAGAKPETETTDLPAQFVIVGSEDQVHLSSYYIGGYSNGLAEELYILYGNR